MMRNIMCAAGVVALLAPGAMAGPKVGDKAPRITAGKWWNLPPGTRKIGLEDLKGRVVVVDFWATW